MAGRIKSVVLGGDMKIYGGSNGSIISILAANDFHSAPGQFASMVEIDENSNAETVSALYASINDYAVVGGVLRRDGVAVTINPDGPQTTATRALNSGYPALPVWAQTGTAADAETFINAQIFNGQTVAQATTYINSTIVNVTTANVAQINAQLGNIRTVFIVAATAIINMRGLFILTAKLLIYIRDLTIRFR